MTAVGGLGREIQIGLGRALLCFGLPDESLLKLRFRLDIGEAGLGCFDIGDSLRQPGAVIPVVDPEQDIACMDSLIVLDLHRRDIAPDLRRERGHVSANIGVVGRCRAA
jgi:hypothetical protein